MARTKIFDEEEATERAMTLFWRKGYAPTSISDLTDEMGINKGSLYHSFSSKNELFKRALQKYNIEHRRATLSRMSEITDPIVAIDTLFSLMIKQSLDDVHKKGCMLVNTAMELPYHESEVHEIVKSGMDEFEEFFRSQLSVAHDRGLVPEELHIDETSIGLLTLVVGLRVMARGVYTESSLNSIRLQALHLISK